MVSSFFLTSVDAGGLFLLIAVVAAARGLFTLRRKLRFHQDGKENNSSSPTSSSSLSSSSSSLSLSSAPSSLSRNWDHNVFPSFHGPDVRKSFLSHLLKEFRNKGIESFIDNNIERSKLIGPELQRAIRGSKIAIVLLSKNYASSSWCLDELVEIMKCNELGQTVMTIFYKVYPTDVRKQTGDFGKVFKETCQGRTVEKIETWRKALVGVATIAGYHSTNCDNEAAMIEEIATDISNKLNISTLSCGFNRYIGMGAHIEKMKPLLRMESDEVRMIGIWGPPGIGKSTIARNLFHMLSNSFQSRANMNVKEIYPKLFCDEYNAQVQIQRQMLSQMFNQQDLVVSHLGVAKQRLNDKKVLLVLDDVDQLAQLDALAENVQWFGRGSRIIIVTEDVRILRKHGINDVYTVELPSDDKALQMFCMYAFGEKYPNNGFEELAWKVVCYAGKLPFGLKVMGSYFRGMSKQEWKNALPKLWRILDGEIESILKFSYDALDVEDKELFLHISCLFVDENATRVKEYLSKRFPYVGEGLDVLANKSLIYVEGNSGKIKMHDLLVRLGMEIVRKQSLNKPGHRQFLLNSREISEILVGDAAGSEEIIGIKFDSNGSELNISERAFEKMSNLQFLKIKGDKLHLPHGLSYLSSKLRLLHWSDFPMTRFPSNINMRFLVELNMRESKLEKFWEGNKPLPNLKWMYLNGSENLKQLPDLSTAINLEILDLSGCSSLVELPSSIENATNLQKLELEYCSSLVKLPSSIGNATNLQELNLDKCSSLVELPSSFGKFIMNRDVLDFTGFSSLSQIPSSIGNAINLKKLFFNGCSSLVELPASIGNLHQLEALVMEECSKLEVLPVNVNLKSLDVLDLDNCSSLKKFPEISTNIRHVFLRRTAIEEVPSSIWSWPRLEELNMSYCKNLKKFAHGLESISEGDTKVQDISPLVKGFPRLDCFSHDITFKVANCFKLNKEARDLIIQTWPAGDVTVLPGKEIPTCFSHRANGASLIVNLKERTFPSSLIFKVCILVVGETCEEVFFNPESCGWSTIDYSYIPMLIRCAIMDKQNSLEVRCGRNGDTDLMIWSLTTEHLYIYKLEADVTSNELFFEFSLSGIPGKWVIKSCGVHYGNCEAEEVNEGHSEENEGGNVEEEEEEEEEENEGDRAETKERKMEQMEADTSVIIDTNSKYTSDSEAGCSKSKVIDHFIEMGFDEENVIKAGLENGEENMEEIANALR